MARLLKVCILLFTLLVTSFTVNATQWHSIDKHLTLLEPNKQAQYLLPNQVLIQGNKCAALIESHGDFVALELLIAKMRTKLPVPVCYLIATNLDVGQLSGMRLLQSAFPDAQVIIPGNGIFSTQTLLRAIDNETKYKLEGFTQSLELSKKRIAQANSEQQMGWHSKLQQAEQRLSRWSTLSPIAVKPLSLNTELDLGDHILHLELMNGYKGAALRVYNPQHKAVFGGHNLDLLPYIAQRETESWQLSLAQLLQRKNINWILPGFGKPYKFEQLSLPNRFFTLVNQPSSPAILNDLIKDYELNKVSSERFSAYYQQALKQKKPNKVLNK
ncbi:hypothetical protein N480_07770 [Pseudoalteromonas luteoviolacea S2607]|uniref:hypothetical protein n=1 Tax=Pseudoalteromonas luteoviolacea TaxID=43657 RepID=UPI0007B081F6|nr:hypothetical protein [Pseudoalteromonas luteoviolacea]KZN29614.1 hypothetical protein N480_07770 [Pseudoalteromonas luteoviolacea S2607]